ncbi:hypothetical protein GGR57DRAFT_509232 [Xylariaceae sp. FL1272]|nr:hypothetical protein GGR57DRAFT_509232 [Xylariaceae sp. FL1272]
MEFEEDGQHSRNARPSSGGRNTQQASRSSAKRRFRGLTCANCRARKIRCEGSQPTCKTCEAYHDECHYDKAPPVSQVLALAARLKEAEQVIASLRAERASRSPADTHTGTWQESATGGIPASAQPPAVEYAAAGQPRHDSVSQHSITSALDSTMDPGHSQNTEYAVSTARNRLLSAASGSRPPPKDVMAPDVTVDEHGEICYYGPTSAVHDPPGADSPASPASTACTNSRSKADMRLALSAHVRESATWEEFALGNASLETGIPRAVMAKLLHTHWTWVSPMFMWVYRPAFVRDMATGGRYYSEFLLTVICAHSAKYQDGNFVDMLLARARRLLGTAIQRPSSIPTIQALLQLSARDLAHGSISQAWVYSGIAFRMASDLGLQHCGADLKGMSAIDLTVRRRLFWGCYFWDKATSLYAGRLPAMTEVLDPNTLDLLDDIDELDTWSPYFGDTTYTTYLPTPRQSQYPTMRSYSVSCFVNSCKLAMIISHVIIQLYDRRNRSMTEVVIKDINARLDTWRAQSPSHLKYDPDNLPAVCPPPHLIAQNLLYFTTVILANRPFWSVPAYYEVCISASRSIEKLVLLVESTFGLVNITYLMGYCIYTGASAILEDAKSGKGAANDTIKTFLRALNAGMKNCPLLERSLNIIVKGLARSPAPKKPKDAQDSRQLPDLPVPLGPYNGYIPAFPYLGPDRSFEFDFHSYPSGHDSLAALDCFPEMQMSMGDFVYPSV